jgi:hypothetical protein
VIARPQDLPAEPTSAAPRRVADVTRSPREGTQDDTIRIMTRETGLWPLIIWVTLPFWALMTVTRVLSYAVRVAAIPGVTIAEPAARTLQHVFLYFVLIGFYRIAFAIGWPAVKRWRAALWHFLLAVLFACLATPFLTVGIDITKGKLHWVATMFEPGAIQEQLYEWWRSGILAVSIPDFLLSYVFGLGLIVAVRTYLELRDNRLRLAQLHSESVRARLHALRMQLHPHFLFNTLHSVSGLIDQRPAVARQIVVRLGDLLRRTLRDGDADRVALAREVEFVRNYLEIQQLRFPDRLRFSIRVDEAVQEAMVPNLILQPLAENAVVHGAAEEEERVDVTIEARQVIDSKQLTRWLELTVHNTGAAQSETEGSGASIGLMNTRARLRAMYGDRCSVESGATPDGYLARLRLPFEEDVP